MFFMYLCIFMRHKNILINKVCHKTKKKGYESLDYNVTHQNTGLSRQSIVNQ